MAFFIPSEYQTAIFSWIREGSGDAMVNAVAGSGKTTTIVQAANIVRGRGLFCAFNKHIAETLKTRLQGTTMSATTIHAFGFGICSRALTGRNGGPKNLTVKKDKYNAIAKSYADFTASPELRTMANLPGKENAEIRRQARQVIRGRGRALAKLVDMVRLTRTISGDVEAMRGLMTTYDITTDGDEGDRIVLAGVRPVLDQGIDQAERGAIVDYTDMIWLPLVLRMNVPVYSWVFVDECQDLNACQRELILRARAMGGRFLFVGDDRQAIMGFAGADSRSFWNIQEITDATVLPLSICYRCPESHVSLARNIVPQIEAAATAKTGEIKWCYEANAAGLIGEGDLIMCRMTAPLVSLCLRLIRSGKPARVRGRDIAAQLIELAETVGEIADTYPPVSFVEALEKWENSQIERLIELEDAEERIEKVRDMAEALRVCYMEPRFGGTVAGICDGIRNMFADEDASIWLSTVHRAKGLEADNTFILHPRALPLHRRDQSEEQFAQELNIAYVALTRAKVRMTFIHKNHDPAPADLLDNLGALSRPQASIAWDASEEREDY